MTQLALLEVMDKEASIPGMWAWALLLGIGGYFACRRWPWAVLILVPVVGVGTWGLFGEINDPYVGPAILDEAGPSYPWHAAATGAVGAILPLIGLIAGRAARRPPTDSITP